jgi:hypothetical protein
MGANKYRNHVLVLPEDRAGHEMANGFQLHESVDTRVIQVLPNAGGWSRVRDGFAQELIAGMNKYPQRYVVLLVDFDRQEARLGDMKSVIPQELVDRVFVIGVWSEPEDLRREVGLDFENIGRKLASECRDDSKDLWYHPLLQHNADELERMTAVLKPFLFPSS